MWVILIGLAFGGGDGRPDAFRQLDEVLPTPDLVRTATGRPGPDYWQQQVDYQIAVTIDEKNARITGQETITYHNQSPDTLPYLWVHLEPSLVRPSAQGALMARAPNMNDTTYEGYARMLERATFDGMMKVQHVQDGEGQDLTHHILDTTMRVELPSPIAPGESFSLDIGWSYRIPDGTRYRTRSGYESFPDGRKLFEMAQFFPRVAAYTDVRGWHHEPYTGRGEFTLEFGNYDLAITVPDDHVVAATGELTNPHEVLKPSWRDRLEKASQAHEPVPIITAKEAGRRSQAQGQKTWTFHADRVRDVAFATSSRFAWDAMRHTPPGGEPVWAMSYWPPEADGLWAPYSTWAVVHTLDIYSEFAFPYPYPVAISVNGPVGGMEYPMICFNGPRPTEEGDWYGTFDDGMPWDHSKYGLISVIIHEVGHNWFPMIVNTDERHWTWMDEGLNTYVQFLAEQMWEPNYPSRRGEGRDLADYLSSTDRVPVMTHSEGLVQFGSNAYATPATALNVLRESVIGRTMMDEAFRDYASTWAFKRPMPADFFRLMEDASGTDLDWFWRGWFYGTDHVDVDVANVRLWRVNTQNPDVEKDREKTQRSKEPESLTQQRNAGVTTLADRRPELLDFYSTYDPLDVHKPDRDTYLELLDQLDPQERALLDDRHWLVEVELVNHGGMVTHVPLEFTYADGTTEEIRVPADFWRRDARSGRQLWFRTQPVTSVRFDPHWETPDANRANDVFPREVEELRLNLTKEEEIIPPMRLP